MRIAVTMSYTPNWNELAAISVPNMAKYCAKHGYSLFVTVDEYERYNGLWKLQNILRLLSFKDSYDVVFSFDCDTLVTNHEIKLESFIDEENHFYVCEGWNMGIFAVKSSTFGIELIYKIEEFIASGKCDCEQDAIGKISIQQGMKVLAHPAFNSYLSQHYPEVAQPVTKEQGQWEPGCFVLHLPALPLEQRINLMKEYSKYIVL